MKVLVYGMQSSGASLATFFLGQLSDSLVVADLYSCVIAPKLEDIQGKYIIVKCVVTTKVSLATHIEQFQPDIKILILRHPLHNYASLKKKNWVNESGTIKKKFEVLEKIFADRDQFNLVLHYEDFLLEPQYVVDQLVSIGLPVHQNFFKFQRSRDQILKFNIQQSKWCRDTYKTAWNFGNIHFQALKGEQSTGMDRSLLLKPTNWLDRWVIKRKCPSLLRYYQELYRNYGIGR